MPERDEDRPGDWFRDPGPGTGAVGDADAEEASRRTPRLWILAAVGVAVLLVGAAAVAALWPCPNGASNAAPTAERGGGAAVVVPEKAAPAPDDGRLDDAAAADIVQHIVAVPYEPAETSEELDTRLGDVAEGSYLAELEAEWQELLSAGWSISGTPRVVTAEVTDVDADGERATVAACVDSSAVRTLDAAGDPIGENATPRALHIFTLALTPGGTWRIAAHGFLDDPAC